MTSNKLAKKYTDQILSDIKNQSPEMQDIVKRMIESELEWAREHKDEKICSRCGKLNHS